MPLHREGWAFERTSPRFVRLSRPRSSLVLLRRQVRQESQEVSTEKEVKVKDKKSRQYRPRRFWRLLQYLHSSFKKISKTPKAWEQFPSV